VATSLAAALALCPLPLSTDAGAVGTLMPEALRGSWTDSFDGPCTFVVDPDGYQGMADGEGYSCKLLKIASNGAGAWSADFTCSGEFEPAHISTEIRTEDHISGLRMEMRQTVDPRDADKVSVDAVATYVKCEK
jgi:hypothetical protein